jgi:hypothetical protein
MTSLKKQVESSQMSDRSAKALAALRRAAIVARRRALENAGGVTIYRDGEMVWEMDPKRIFPEGVEVKICECGRVLVKDLLDDTDYLGR